MNHISKFYGRSRGVVIHPRTGFIRGDVGYTDGANFYFQHLTAKGAKAALRNVAKECYLDKSSALYGSRPVIFMHDEIILEVPESVSSEAGERLAEVMRTSMSTYLPDVPVKCGPWLARRWFKEAETKRDGNGKLLLWEVE